MLGEQQIQRLQDGLPIADGLIQATLLEGDYLVTHAFGWTQFDLDPLTQALTVTTYGIDSYTETQMSSTETLYSDPSTIAGRTPGVLSRFVVQAQGVVPVPATLALPIPALVLLCRR